MNGDGAVEVLLAEDNPYDAELVIRAMRKGKFVNKIVWAKDGIETIDFLRCSGIYAGRDPSEVPKLILLDLKMPKVDGFDVLRSLKENDRTRCVPVVVMTSSAEERDVAASYRLGANGYVVKPVDSADLTDAVARIGMFWLQLNRVPPP